MNEAETRAELIDPKLTTCGWGVVEDSKVLREYHITAGKIQTGGKRAKPDRILFPAPALLQPSRETVGTSPRSST